MRKFSAKWVPKCLKANQKRQKVQKSEQILEISRCDRNDFPSRLVTMDENWLYHYVPRQSNSQCSDGIAAHPDQNIPSAKFLWNISRLEYFGDQYSILFIECFTKGQTINAECYSYLLVHLEDTLKENLVGKFPKGFWSYTSIWRLAGHLQSKRNWPTWASSILITRPIPRIWPRRKTTCSLDWRNNWKLAIFLPKQSSLLTRRLGWMDKFLIFFSCLQKLEQSAEKCTELRGEYVEQVSSLFAVDFFIPVRVTDLSATPLILTFLGKYIELYVILNCVLLSVFQWDLKWDLLIHEAAVETGMISKNRS